MKNYFHVSFTGVIALVWLANGMYCKLLNRVPRHQLIVARILRTNYAVLITKMIGIAEVIMAVWVSSGIYPWLNALLQITIIGIMNVIEFIYAPDLLLWGKFNALFASLFMMFIFLNEFMFHPNLSV